jgi:RNA polymerase sigma-70 factor, ECF subfamily
VIDRKGRTWAADLEALFESDYSGLVRALTVICGDRDVAIDAVTEAFARAWERWPGIRAYDDPAAWIRRVAINRARTEHRDARRRRVAAGRLAVERGAEGAAAADRTTDPDLVDALRGLPDRQREAIALYYLADLSVRDTALTMELREGTVKAHLHQARARLAIQIGARS